MYSECMLKGLRCGERIPMAKKTYISTAKQTCIANETILTQFSQSICFFSK